MNKKIGVLGVGVVGSCIKRYFESLEGYEIFLYDKNGTGSLEQLNMADFVYVCLPTPYVPEKGCDISIVENGIAQLSGEKIVIIKSTILPGTTEALQKKFPQHKILFNPEFLTEDNADKDMCYPDKQIVGYTEKSRDVAQDVLSQLPVSLYSKIIPSKAAELIKYANNTFLAVKVAINNELYDLAKKIGFSEEEWNEVVAGIASDKRIGGSHLDIVHQGKRGYWGKCLPKDVKALLNFAEQNGVNMPVRNAVDEYNDKLLKSQNLKEYI